MIVNLAGKTPKIHKTCFIAENACVIGDVKIGEWSSVWMGAVIRGDYAPIKIGKYTSIQDNCVLHASEGLPVIVGNYVTVGHSAILHSCKVESYSLIGINSVVLDGVKVGRYSIVGAGAVVTKNVPRKSLAIGVPAKIVRKITSKEIKEIKKGALTYVNFAKLYQKK